MDIVRTLNFLKTTRLALITCADETRLGNFVNFISTLIKLSDADFSVEIEITSTVPRKEVSQKLATIIEHSKAKSNFVPFKCDKYSELRSIYFHLPENIKSAVEIFVLRETVVGVKLECELGILQGCYMLYDYSATTGTFTEKN